MVEPTGEKFTTDDLIGQLLLALREILRFNKMRSFPREENEVSPK